MNKNDWLFVGLKLVGVYFFVTGAIGLLAILISFVYSLQQQEMANPAVYGYFAIQWLQILQPAIYLACATVLIRRTDWCLRFVCPEDGKEIEPVN